MCYSYRFFFEHGVKVIDGGFLCHISFMPRTELSWFGIKMSWIQKDLVIPPKSRGFHVITYDVLRQIPEIRQFEVGIAHFFLQHTSASLALNEGVDPDVRADMEMYFERAVPENADYYIHTHEGPDDLPAHIKNVLIGHSLSIPIADGKLALGAWQGLYLCEHRDLARARRIVVTMSGQLIGNE